MSRIEFFFIANVNQKHIWIVRNHFLQFSVIEFHGKSFVANHLHGSSRAIIRIDGNARRTNQGFRLLATGDAFVYVGRSYDRLFHSLGTIFFSRFFLLWIRSTQSITKPMIVQQAARVIAISMVQLLILKGASPAGIGEHCHRTL